MRKQNPEQHDFTKAIPRSIGALIASTALVIGGYIAMNRAGFIGSLNSEPPEVSCSQNMKKIQVAEDDNWQDVARNIQAEDRVTIGGIERTIQQMHGTARPEAGILLIPDSCGRS